MLRAVSVAALCGLLAACGSDVAVGNSPSAPTPPPSSGGGAPPTPAPPGTTVTITSAGLSPRQITIAVGERVTFSNQDSRPHDLAGGPDPTRPDCPEIDAAGFIGPGQTRQSAAFTAARTCEYHDHAFIGVAAFQGRVVVQ